MTEEPFTYWRTIRFGDTDPAGIVYTPNFINYCLEAIEVWLIEKIDINWAHMNLVEHGGTPFVHVDIDFTAIVRANDWLGIAVRVEKIGGSSLTVALQGLRRRGDSDELVTAFNSRYVMCFIDNADGPIQIPEKNRERLEAYQAATGLPDV